jgi:hypothetical protein
VEGKERARDWLKGGRPVEPPVKLAPMSSHRHFFCCSNTLATLAQHAAVGLGARPCAYARQSRSESRGSTQESSGDDPNVGEAAMIITAARLRTHFIILEI